MSSASNFNIHTIFLVYKMPQTGDCGYTEIAVPLHRRKDIVLFKDIVT